MMAPEWPMFLQFQRIPAFRLSDYSDYGHIVIRTKNSHSNSSQDSSLKSHKRTTMMRSNIELKKAAQ